MLYIYDKQNKSLVPCAGTEFASHGLLERRDLAKWVEQHPAILGEELLIVTSEYDRFDKTNERLDLLGIDKYGNLAVIELKRDDSGKNVDLQAVKYAAYCSTLRFADVVEMYMKYQRLKGVEMTQEAAKDALIEFIENDDFEELSDRPRIILVASEFRPEVTASVLWLRKFALDISCVKWDAYELSNGYLAVNSSVLIPLPEAEDYIIQTEKKDIAEHSTTLTQAEYEQFYAECIELLRKKLQREYTPPGPKYYYQILTGLGGVHFEWTFHGRPRSSFGVELHFENGDRETNLKLLSACAKLKDKLEVALGENLIVQPDWGKTWARLYVEKQQGTITSDLRNWAVEKMQTLIQLLQPELDKIRKR